MNQLDKAIKNLGFKRVINLPEKKLRLACLLREEDRRPLQANWWKGKQSYLVAVDDNGNFLVSHCGGHIFYWDHAKKTEQVVAKSEVEFLSMIEIGD